VGALHDGSTAQLRAMLDVHLMATFWTMLPALGHMRARGRGRIVNTVSGTGMFPRAGTFAYAAAKAAVQAMTRSAALDNSDLDIGINAISPIAATPMSPTYTEVHPALDDERMSVHRVVPALVFLAHPSCRLTGEVWHAAGGRVARAGYYVSRGWGSDTLTAEDVAQHVEQICDVGQPLVLQNSWQQYDYIPKGPDDYEAWRQPDEADRPAFVDRNRLSRRPGRRREASSVPLTGKRRCRPCGRGRRLLPVGFPRHGVLRSNVRPIASFLVGIGTCQGGPGRAAPFNRDGEEKRSGVDRRRHHRGSGFGQPVGAVGQWREGALRDFG
jgi:hypothetical protein